MKKVGIVVDNYKVNTFLNQLGKAGFDPIYIIPYNDTLKLIKFEAEESKIGLVAAICRKLEIDFKQSN